MTDYKKMLDVQARKLKKALKHLKYSFERIRTLSVDNPDERQLADWESFVARFSRASDIYLTKFLRSSILLDDPGFNGSFRDVLNRAEKLNLIGETDIWLAIRDLRNKAAHEYDEENLSRLFEEMRKLASHLLEIEKKIL